MSDIEKGTVGSSFADFQRIYELEAQRDELLAALGEVRKNTFTQSSAWKIADAAITKAKETQ